MHRRDLLKVSFASGAALVGAAVLGMDATAGRNWCYNEPLIVVDGYHIDITFRAYDDINQAVTGPTQIEVRVPVGSAYSVEHYDAGFGGLGYSLTFIEDATCTYTAAGSPRVKTKAYVPSGPDPVTGSTFPVIMVADPMDTGSGSATVQFRTNQWSPTASVYG